MEKMDSITVKLYAMGVVIVILFILIFYFLGLDIKMFHDSGTYNTACISTGHAGYVSDDGIYNGLKTIQNQTYLKCYSETSINGLTNRTEQWVAYNLSKP